MDDLRVGTDRHELLAVDHLHLPARRRLGIVGESGSGKTMLVLSIAGLHAPGITISGSVSFMGRNIVGLSGKERADVLGNEIGIIFQDPSRALNPTMRIGKQVAEAVLLHSDAHKREREERVLELLAEVQLRDPRSIVRRYPHELSGGQQQRVMCAIAIASEPKLLIADEPTTALDVTVQRRILELLVRLSEEKDMALIFVSHDLGVVQSVSDDIAVMYAGRVVEVGESQDVLNSGRHRYTEALVGVNTRLGGAEEIRSNMGRRLDVIEGMVASPGGFPTGCRFRDRCAFATLDCEQAPPVTTLEKGHWFTCWHPTPNPVLSTASYQ